MLELINAYENHLIKVKMASGNTVSSYMRDIRQFSDWLNEAEGVDVIDASQLNISDYLARLEQEYMTLFVGYSEFQTQKMRFDVVPDAARENQMYIAFRLSDDNGLVAADNLSGKPVLIEFIPQDVAPVNVEVSQKDAKKTSTFSHV